MSASLGKPRFDRLVGWSTGLAGWVAAACLTLALLATIQHVLGTEVYDDEAETALLGRSVLQSGLPRLTQEGQYFSNQRGADFGPRGEDSHHGWLPAYTAAVGWQLTAEPSANLPFVRAPFIVWALITVGALLYLARASGLPWSLAVAVTASVSLTGRWFAPLFATRYFGCAALGLTLMLLAFRHERWRPRALNYLLGALLLFHAQWAHGLPVILATAPLLWWGGKPRASVPSAIWSATLLAAGTVTLLAYTKPLGKIVLTEDRLTLLGQLVEPSTWQELGQLFPLLGSTTLAASLIAARVPSLRRFVVPAVASIVVTLVVSTQAHMLLRPRYFYFLAPAYLSLITAIAGALITATHRSRRPLTTLLLASAASLISSLSLPDFLPGGAQLPKTTTYVPLFEWLKREVPKGDSVYVNFDRRDFLLHTDLNIVNASDFSALEHGAIVSPLPLKSDPTYVPFHEVDWLLWDVGAHTRAHSGLWLLPNYVQLKRVPEGFVEQYRFAQYLVLRNHAKGQAENP